MLTLKDWTSEEIKDILEKAIEIKKNPSVWNNVLKGKTMIMLFEKTSTRTRLSFEAGMTQLGGHAIFLDKRTTQFMIADFIDEIRATMRFGDILMYRPLKHQSLVEAARFDRMPVINACCEKYHPCQALADALTMIEKSGETLDSFKGKKVVWLGIGNNVSNSLVQVCTKLGAKITLCIAEKDLSAIDPELERQAMETGLYQETDALNSLHDADFVHTDTWINMEFFDKNGKMIEKFKGEFERRKKTFMPLQLNKALLDKYESKAKIMHCMACHVDYEISRDAIEHPNSIIFDQAENRLHVQKALILKLLGIG